MTERASIRQRLKPVLARVGLLGPAERARDLWRVARAWRRNARYRGKPTPDGLPLPPAELILQVAGTPDIEWYLDAGQRAADNIRSVLARNAIEMSALRALLDFGCGCGRVLRHWSGLKADVHGCDYNPRLVRWCRRALPFARFETNRLEPPLPYPDARFDFVYALSIFSHFTGALQSAWMQELRRVLAPGGHLLFTVHGLRYRSELDEDQRRRFDSGELVVVHGDRAGKNVCGAYHPEEYVRRLVAPGFEVVEFAPEGALGNPHQDLYLLKKT